VEPAYPLPLRLTGALCSFAVPGLGQIVQGVSRQDANRWSKGLFFLLALNGMFLYGLWLGEGQNVFLPHQHEQLVHDGKPTQVLGWDPPPLIGNMVFVRLQYLGQVWIGLAAWPALWNYYEPDHPILEKYFASPGSVGLRHLDPDTRERLEARRAQEPAEYQRELKGALEHLRQKDLEDHERQLIDLQKKENMGKVWDVAWVYTVIAGVLNLLVIYDAWAGPVKTRPQPAADAKKGGGA
jgi:hypothetical protein